MNRVRSSIWLIAAATASFAAAAVHGMSSQAAAPPPPAAASAFKNLKVLPAEIPRDRLIMVMKNFSTSLGVKCTFCHVGEEGKPATMDFASDTNPHKNIARKMMAMTRRINEQDFGITDFTKSEVSCYTCHRGAKHPLTAAPSPTTEAPKPHAH